MVPGTTDDVAECTSVWTRTKVFSLRPSDPGKSCVRCWERVAGGTPEHGMFPRIVVLRRDAHACFTVPIDG